MIIRAVGEGRGGKGLGGGGAKRAERQSGWESGGQGGRVRNATTKVGLTYLRNQVYVGCRNIVRDSRGGGGGSFIAQVPSNVSTCTFLGERGWWAHCKSEIDR